MSESYVRPIILRPQWLSEARQGKRTHICLPASFIPKTRTAVSDEARAAQSRRAAAEGAMPMPSVWMRLAAGDRLWVQEEVGEVADAKNALGTLLYYKLELPGGHIPIPGGTKGSRYTTRWHAPVSMVREHSRFWLHVTEVRHFNCQDIAWAEMAAEGRVDPHETKGAWWQYRYGFTMSWAENPAVVGVSFTMVEGNIDGAGRAPDGPAVFDGKWPKPVETARAMMMRAERDLTTEEENGH